MSSKKKSGKTSQTDKSSQVATPTEESVAVAESPKKKGSYNPKAAKAYRERIMEFAKLGGYEPKPRAKGTGLTEKRTSKKGTTYYYQPWSSLTDEQKKTRLAQARERAARDREMARKYREEHPEASSVRED